MLLASGGGLIIADHTSFAFMYQLMAAFMALCVIVTLWAVEPPLPEGAPKTLQEAVIEPFRDYFTREGAWIALAFILLYKIGDIMASSITTPFYLELGYSKTEIGAVVKLFGFWATIVGSLLGGGFTGGSLLLLAGDHGGPHGLLNQAAALEQGQHAVGGLSTLGQAGADRLGVETGLLGAGVVEAQLLQGAAVTTAGAVAGHQAEARFPLLAEPLQAELDHCGLALLTGIGVA